MFVLPQNLEDTERSIAHSHERSKVYKIDPNITKAPESSRLRPGELKERIESQKLFYTVAKEQIDKLYHLIKNTGFCLALADKDGYVLYVVGDSDLEELFQKDNCMPGYRWTEMDTGTCAIGLALIDKKPVFIPAGKLYADLSKNISHTGAPVFDPDGSLLGVISLCGYAEKMHLHTLGLICQTAEAAASHYKEYLNSKELAVKNKYMSALLEAGTKGIISTDLNGCIMQANGKARSLLDLDQDCQGKSFSALTKIKLNFEQNLQNGFLAKEICTKNKDCFLDLAPIAMNNGETVGAMLTVTEKKEMLQLAAKITGAKARFTFDSIIGSSPRFLEAVEIAQIASKNTASLLLCGETGTGKELFAHAVHNAGNRRERPFVTLNCGTVPSELLENELFGYETDVFANPLNEKQPGKLELADTGTLFLNEIGNIPLQLQSKLLNILQTGEISRTGAAAVPLDIRFIFATTKDLKKEIEKGRFLPDLFYRITALSVVIPPLRERKEDIPLLAEYFFRQAAGNSQKQLSPKTCSLLLNYPWHENVRQLKSAVERAIRLADGKTIKAEHFGIDENEHFVKTASDMPLDEIEKKVIENSIRRHEGNMSACAKSLGISRPTLYRKLEKYGIAFQEQ